MKNELKGLDILFIVVMSCKRFRIFDKYFTFSHLQVFMSRKDYDQNCWLYGLMHLQKVQKEPLNPFQLR